MHRFTHKSILLLGQLIVLAGFLTVLVWLKTSNPAWGASGQVIWPDISLEAWSSPLNRPVTITHAADASERVFVVEQRGTIRIIQGDQVSPVFFLDIQEQVKCCGEEGLLGLAFPADYEDNGNFYVYYTRLDGNNQVSRFSIGPDSDIADPDSEQEILYLHHPTNTNHNGGQLAFGPDGYLYIGTGDGGGGGDPQNNAQNLRSLLGKILRLEVSASNPTQLELENRLYFPLLNGGAGTSTGTYSIPSDNPFRDDPNALPEIWAFGLRNPWRFSFDNQTGDLYIADVGQNAMEEVNFQPASSTGGENYGWKILEGELCFNPSTGCNPPTNYNPPVAVYERSLGCSVTGGEVYRGTDFPALQGIYLFGDYCSGRIWGLVEDGSEWQSQELADTDLRISTFGSDENGNMYVADLNTGQIYRITASP